jgi:hypothetical protein
MSTEPSVILPAEHVGVATVVDGHLDVGGVKIPVPWSTALVYVRRSGRDLSVAEIAIAFHDGLTQEQFSAQTAEAARYPGGPKEYWRGEMVGKFRTGTDRHLLTEAEFEADWDEGSS